MIEEIVYNHLTGTLKVPVYLEIPENMPDTFVFIEKEGGGETEYITNSTVAVQSYAPSLYEAAELNAEVKSAMRELISHKDILRIELNSDYPFNDLTRKRRRYQAVFNITHY